MRLVRVKSPGLTTLQGENAVSPSKIPRTNNATVHVKTSGLTTLRAENAVSPDKNFWTNNDMGLKCG